MNRILAALAAMIFLAATIAGCGERPQRPTPKSEKASYNGQDQNSPLRERTNSQGESGRIGY
jgi:predicted small lipoprotein YifL